MAALHGRRALVTGASRNLGPVIAGRLASEGAKVAVNYRESRAEAESVVAELAGGVDAHCAVGGDVSQPEDAVRVASEAADGLGGAVDILVNNAGPFTATPFVELEEAEFDRVWNANVKATYLMTKAVAPAMRTAGWGRIVNISASSAFFRNRSAYTLANASIITLTEELAVELAPEINVNAVAPGQIHESLEELREYVPDWAEVVIAATPKSRLATRIELADLVVLLCSPVFAAVTGATIPVDGGLRLKSF